MEHRRQKILTELESSESCTYDALARICGVSEMTIRRDVDALAERGMLVKTLRGARQLTSGVSLQESELRTRLSLNLEEKRAIARRALGLIPDGATIFLDASTTCLELAKLIARERTGLTVLTHSALACFELGQGPGNRIIGMGGEYDPSSCAFIGPAVEDAIGRYCIDLAFVSTKGFLPAEGIFESAAGTYRVKEIARRRATRLVLLVDATKFGGTRAHQSPRHLRNRHRHHRPQSASGGNCLAGTPGYRGSGGSPS